MKWKTWANVQLKGKNGAKLTKKCLVEKEGTVQELVTALLEQLHPWAHHTFIAKWQFQQYKSLKDNLPESTLLTVADFAENYRCDYQDEISSAYYNYKQATLHPIQCSYWCPDDGALVQEAMVYISDDLKHDNHAVATFNDHLYTYLKDVRKVTVKKHIQFSDGCPTQYKGRTAYHDLQNQKLPSERCFFGSRHGKGPCDSIGAVVKNCASRYVKSRKGIISDAHGMFEYANTHLTINKDHSPPDTHTKRTFVFIPQDIIQKRRDKSKSKPERVPLSRDLHSIMNTKDGGLLKRFLTCFCAPCRNGEYKDCENAAYVDNWVDASEKDGGEMKWKPETKKKTKIAQAVPKKKVDRVQTKESIRKKVELQPRPTPKKKLVRAKKALNQGKVEMQPTSTKNLDRAKGVLRQEKIETRTSKKKLDKAEILSKENVEVVLRQEIEVNSYATRSKLKSKMRTSTNSSPTKETKRRKVVKSPENIPSSNVIENIQRRTRSTAYLQDEEKTSRPSPKKKFKKSKIEPEEKKADQLKSESTTNSARQQNGPLPAKQAKQLMKAMIHAPFHIQVSTASNIVFAEVSVREDLTVAGLKAMIDANALDLMPDDLPSNVCTQGVTSFPIVIDGDGNCLAKVGSLLLYGCETYHTEVRLRIATELILFMECYLDEDFLSAGLPANRRLTPAMVAQFSDSYVGEQLTSEAIKAIFLKEIHQVLRLGDFMGTWQVFALASILKVKLFSAYPKRGNASVRRDLHRVIMPREVSKPDAKMPVVMWSSCRSDMTDEHWVPNHFTVILPVSM